MLPPPHGGTSSHAQRLLTVESTVSADYMCLYTTGVPPLCRAVRPDI